eukprot:COSAG05_NODE_858_length_6935_cov_2.188414_3_plen_1060_part_00
MCLNPNHSHYIFVDSDEDGKFGLEVAIRNELETLISCCDAETRVLTLAALTEHFARIFDHASLHVNGTHMQSGETCVLAEGRENEVTRTASDGATKMEYKLTIVRTDAGAVSMKQGSTDESVDREHRHALHAENKPVDLIRMSLSEGATLVPEFDPRLTEYEVHVPTTFQGSVAVTPHLSSGRKPQAPQGSRPFFTFCYGGGPWLMLLLQGISHGNPIICAKGSERAVQVLEDWLSLEEQKQDKSEQEKLALTEKQVAHAEKSIRREIASSQKPPVSYDEVELLAEKPGWWDVDKFIEALVNAAKHPNLCMWDHSKPMPLTECLIRSLNGESYSSSAMLPAAILLESQAHVDEICKQQGLAVKRKVDWPTTSADPQELTLDGRLLTFAAFHDRGTIVERLLSTGWDPASMDHLIQLEVRKAIDEPSQLRLKSPPPMVELDSHSELHWSTLPLTRRLQALRTLQWSMLPFLSGWTYQLEAVAPMASEVVEQDQTPPHGMRVQALDSHTREVEGGPVVERMFIVLSPEALAGNTLVATDAPFTSKPGEEESGRDPASLVCTFDLSGMSWRAEFLACEDSVTADWLSFQQAQCRFRLPVSSAERKHVQMSFGPWLTEDGLRYPPSKMNDMHRIYWAIRSNRPRLAHVLIQRCEQPVVACLFGAHFYASHRLPVDFVPDARQTTMYMPVAMRSACESRACDILGHAILDQTTTLFDEYVCKAIKPDESLCLNPENLRNALVLMGVDISYDVTRTDLAMIANCKQYTSQTGPAQFLDTLWHSPSNSDAAISRWCAGISSPRVKAVSSIVSFLGFLGVYATFVTTAPTRGEPFDVTSLEHVFWAWTLVFVCSELHTGLTYFRGSFRRYIQSSGNLADCVIFTVFVLAMGCRVVSLLCHRDVKLVGVTTASMIALLCANMLGCCLRFLQMCSISSSIGIMIIILREIMVNNIVPFLAVAGSAVVSFELSAFFFFWVTKTEYDPGVFVKTFFFGTEHLALHGDDTGVIVNMVLSYEALFFIASGVVLMNLLIAMCAAEQILFRTSTFSFWNPPTENHPARKLWKWLL